MLQRVVTSCSKRYLHPVGPSRHFFAGSDDVDFDKRLDALKKGKGAQRNTKRRQEKAAQKGSESKPSAKKSKVVFAVF